MWVIRDASDTTKFFGMMGGVPSWVADQADAVRWHSSADAVAGYASLGIGVAGEPVEIQP